MKMNRRQLLTSSLGASVLSSLPNQAFANGSTKRVVVVRAFGGWDVTYCMDPRLNSSTIDGPNPVGESIESYAGIPIITNDTLRPEATNFFSNHASNTIVVNGISVGSIVHEECRLRILTGGRDNSYADIGALAAIQESAQYTLPYIDLTGGARVGPYAAQTGILGRNNQILALLNRDLPIQSPEGYEFPLYTPVEPQRDAIEAYLEARQSRWSNAIFSGERSSKRIADLQEAQMRKKEVFSERALLLDNLSFGGGGTLNEQADLAVTLLNSGMCHSVALETPQSWDTHDTITDQNNLYRSLFSGLNDLITGLQSNGLFEDTMIVVLSEMTRTPKLNQDGGKDHWPSTSALLISGGLDGGRVLGGTSEDTLEALPVNLNTGLVDTSGSSLSFERFIAGVLHASGIEANDYLPNVEVLHGIID